MQNARTAVQYVQRIYVDSLWPADLLAWPVSLYFFRIFTKNTKQQLHDLFILRVLMCLLCLKRVMPVECREAQAVRTREPWVGS